MSKTLVVFYSRTGYTRRLAQQLAQALNADIDEIHALSSRTGVVGYLRCAIEALRGRPAPIAEPRHDPRQYTRIAVGGPVWAGHVASPVRSYLESQADRLQRLGLFCTYGGSGAEGALRDMAALARRAPVATLALTDRELNRGDSAALAPFVQTLQTPTG